MTAPPARPHMYTTRQVSINSAWADTEDDAWDSGSDNESSRATAFASTSSRPIPVKRTQQFSPTTRPPQSSRDASSQSLAFSFTHVNAPSPSSYPPRPIEPQQGATPQAPRAGWTIVHTSHEHSSSSGSSVAKSVNADVKEHQSDLDVDGDMIVGELDHDSMPYGSTTLVLRPKMGKEVVKADADSIAADPFLVVRNSPLRDHDTVQPRRANTAPVNVSSQASLSRERSTRTKKKNKIIDCLLSEDINLADLRKIAWQGIPNELRPVAWQLLLGYLPLATPARAGALARKREEYASLVRLTFARGRQGLDQQIWHQIEIDVPRTRPGVRLWMEATTQRSLERILYVWAIRHPASGYVQGINDLVTPFFQIFLSAYIDGDPEQFDPGLLPDQVLAAVEADSFWCLSRLLDGIQDNYISAQPGIQRNVKRMAELVARIDAPLSDHLRAQNVEFMQFAFRWMNCLLMREISVRNTIRMWDTYLAEGADAFSQFHLYVCCAFLVKWSSKLREMDFQGIIMFLQSLPTQGWGDHEIELLLSEAFLLNTVWHNAQSHFS